MAGCGGGGLCHLLCRARAGAAVSLVAAGVSGAGGQDGGGGGEVEGVGAHDFVVMPRLAPLFAHRPYRISKRR